MLSLITKTALLAAAALQVSGQTFTSCDPTKKECPPNPALAVPDFYSDFTQGPSSNEGWLTTSGAINYGPSGAEFTINKRFDAPTIQTEFYIFFGYVEVKMRAAPGVGVVSSIVLQSDNLDEVDWEFLGGFNGEVQTNYFGKGNTTTYDRMIAYPVSTPQDVTHTYAVDWTAERINWIIDGVTVRTLAFEDANGGLNFPQTPMNVRLGIWAGGDPSNSPGTIMWAGGETDFTKGPYTMVIESVKVVNYSPGVAYRFTDLSGSWESIEIIGEETDTATETGSSTTESLESSPTHDVSTSASEPHSSSPTDYHSGSSAAGGSSADDTMHQSNSGVSGGIVASSTSGHVVATHDSALGSHTTSVTLVDHSTTTICETTETADSNGAKPPSATTTVEGVHDTPYVLEESHQPPSGHVSPEQPSPVYSVPEQPDHSPAVPHASEEVPVDSDGPAACPYAPETMQPGEIAPDCENVSGPQPHAPSEDVSGPQPQSPSVPQNHGVVNETPQEQSTATATNMLGDSPSSAAEAGYEQPDVITQEFIAPDGTTKTLIVSGVRRSSATPTMDYSSLEQHAPYTASVPTVTKPAPTEVGTVASIRLPTGSVNSTRTAVPIVEFTGGVSGHGNACHGMFVVAAISAFVALSLL